MTKYRDEIPAAAEPRFNPRTRGTIGESTQGDLAVKGPRGFPIRETSSGCIYPEERGRRRRTGLSRRFTE